MATDSSVFDSDAPESPLDRAIIEFLTAQGAGIPVDVKSFLEKHAEVASELDTFIHQQVQMGRLMSPVRRITELVKSQSSEPEDFGDYKIIREIGRGGMGVIYEAQQQGLKRKVALKMIRENRFLTEESLIRFQAEAEAAAALDHPNIVPVYRVGNVEARPFFTMKLVRGGSLKERLADGPFRAKEAARIAGLIADAVNFAHQHGILHRDLKPANILMDQRSSSGSSSNFSKSVTYTSDTGIIQTASRAESPSQTKKHSNSNLSSGLDTPMISDFGLAKQLGDENTCDLTIAGAVLGTPSFMSPEQASGEVVLTTATDIYSVGAILCSMLTGNPPFDGTTPGEITRKVIEQTPSLSNPSTNIDDDLKTICLKCLEKAPKDRYKSAAELSQDLRRFVEGKPIHARRAGALEQTVKWSRRNPLLATLVGTVVVLLLLTTIGSIFFSLRLNKEATERGFALQKLQIEESKTAAQRDQALRLLYESKFQEVAARRSSGESGHRFAALKAAEEAVSQIPFITVSDREIFELRSETVGCLGNLDLIETDSWSSSTYSYTAIAFTPDLKLCASHSDRNDPLLVHRTEELIQAGTDKKAQPIVSFDLDKTMLGGPFRCKFSDCGSYLSASTVNDQKMVSQFVFDLKNKTTLLYEKEVSHACFGESDGVALLASATAQEISIRRLPSLEPVASFPNPSSGTNNLLSFSRDGNWLIRHGSGGLVVFDLKAEEIATQVAGNFFDLSWHPTKKEFAVTNTDSAEIWRLENGDITLVSKFPKHTHEVFQVEYSPDGLVLATSTWNHNTRFWDVESGEQLFSSVGFINQFSADGNKVAMSGAKVSIFRYEGQRSRKTITQSDEKTEVARPVDIDVHPGNRWVAVGDNKSIQIGDLKSATKLIDLPGSGRLRFHPRKSYLVASGLQGGVKKWPFNEKQLSSGRTELTIGPPSILLNVNAGRGLDLDPDGEYIGVISGGSAQVMLIDDVRKVVQMKSKHKRGVLSGISLSRGCRFVAVGNHLGRNVQVFDGRTGDLVHTVKTPGIAKGKISPDGDLLSVTYNNTAEVYDTKDWSLLYSLRENDFEVAWPASFSDDGSQLLLTLRKPRGTLLLDAKTGHKLIRIPGAAGTAPRDARPVLTTNQQVVMIREGNSLESWDLAEIRKQLATIGLDWELEREAQHESDRKSETTTELTIHKPEVEIDWGESSRLEAYRSALQRVYERYGKHSAQIAFQNWRKNYPYDAELWHARGLVHRRFNNRQCIEDWTEAIACKDCEPVVYLSRAVSGITFNQRARVAEDLKKYLGENDEPSFAQSRASRVLAWEIGLNFQDRQWHPDELKTALTLATTSEEWFANAEPSTEPLNNNQIQHVLAIKALALMHIRDKNPIAAIELLENHELMKSEPQTSIAFGVEHMLGLAYAVAGKDEQARKQYHSAVASRTQFKMIESFRAAEWVKLKAELEAALDIAPKTKLHWSPLELAAKAAWDLGTIQVQFVSNAHRFDSEEESIETTSQTAENLLWSAGREGRLTLSLHVDQPGIYDISIGFSRAADFGMVEFSVNGQTVGTRYDGFFDTQNPGADSAKFVFGDQVTLGETKLFKGKNELVLKIVGRSPKAKGFNAGIEFLKLKKL